MKKTELFGYWRHAHEEDDDERVVYRRDGADLPPSRGRDALDLQPDGTAVRIAIDPADRHAAQMCNWSLDGDEIVLTEGDVELRRLRVVELTPDKIVLEKRRA